MAKSPWQLVTSPWQSWLDCHSFLFARGSTKQQDASKIYQNLSGAMRSGKAISMEMTSLSYHQLIPFHPLSGLLKHFLQELDPRHILPQFTEQMLNDTSCFLVVCSVFQNRCRKLPQFIPILVRSIGEPIKLCRSSIY